MEIFLSAALGLGYFVHKGAAMLASECGGGRVFDNTHTNSLNLAVNTNNINLYQCPQNPIPRPFLGTN
jgi:hypothetical protein